MQGDYRRPSNRTNRFSRLLMLVGGSALVAAVALLILTYTGVLGGSNYSGPGTSSAFGEDVSRFLTPLPTPPALLPPASDAPVVRLAIPRFAIDAPVSAKGVDANNVMEVPNGPTDVVWYDFSARPGSGSNAIFSGHVDYIDYGPAVFWNLKDLVQGDVVDVSLEDGTVYRYSVTDREMIPANPGEAKLAEVLGPTQRDIITMITCGGTFDPSTGQYDQRVIVRAERLAGEATADSEAAAP